MRAVVLLFVAMHPHCVLLISMFAFSSSVDLFLILVKLFN